MIIIQNFRIGDIVGTTSGSPLAMLIKARTWGWRSALSQSKSSHIATVVDRGNGLLYFAEMLSGGIHLTEIHSYDHRAPNPHICFVGRHAALCGSIGPTPVNSFATLYNNTILALHARKVKYGYDDMVNYIMESFRIKIRDKESTLICSELPRVGFDASFIPYPESWASRCSPMDWQCWPLLENVTRSIVS